MAGERPAIIVTSVHTLPPQGSEDSSKSRLESRLWRVTGKVYSRHDRNIAPMSLQQLWMPPRNLKKKVSQHPNMDGEGS